LALARCTLARCRWAKAGPASAVVRRCPPSGPASQVTVGGRCLSSAVGRRPSVYSASPGPSGDDPVGPSRPLLLCVARPSSSLSAVALKRRQNAAFWFFAPEIWRVKSRTPRNRTFSPAENQIRYFRGRIVNRTSAPVTVSTISTLAPCYAFRSFEVCGRCGRRRCIQGCVCCDVTGRKRGQWHRHDGGEVGGVERRQNRGGTERAFVRFSLSVHRERTSADAARPRCHAACVGGVCVGTAAGAEYAYTFTRVLINSRNLWWA